MVKYLFISLLIVTGCHEPEDLPIPGILADEIIEPDAIGVEPEVFHDSLPQDFTSHYLVLDTVLFDAFVDSLREKIVGTYRGNCYSVNAYFDLATGIWDITYDTSYNNQYTIQEVINDGQGVTINVFGDCSFVQSFSFQKALFEQDSLKDAVIMGVHRTDITIYYNYDVIQTKAHSNAPNGPSYWETKGYFIKE